MREINLKIVEEIIFNYESPEMNIKKIKKKRIKKKPRISKFHLIGSSKKNLSKSFDFSKQRSHEKIEI